MNVTALIFRLLFNAISLFFLFACSGRMFHGGHMLSVLCVVIDMVCFWEALGREGVYIITPHTVSAVCLWAYTWHTTTPTPQVLCKSMCS